MKKKFITFLLLLFVIAGATAQSSVDSVALRAMQVGRVMQQERVYLHFDNTAYYLGETMWFKAYVSFGADNRPGTLSKVLYVELVAPEGYVVETKKYKLDDNGCCNGEFELTPLLLSGYYEIRAYTRYMLNWDKEAIFSRVFPIFDKVNADNWEFRNMLDRQRSFLQNGKWVSHELPDVTLDFYPESGHLVDGLQSRVAFELREHDGLFSEEKIRIYKDGEFFTEATPSHLGKGLFEITPEADAKYHAEVVVKNKKGKDKKYSFDLPEVSENGAVMRVQELADSIMVEIRNNSSVYDEYGFVVLHRGTMGFYQKLYGKIAVDTVLLAKNDLPEGVNRVVLFVDEYTPLAERQFFVMHDSLQNKGSETVKLNVLANNYHVHNLQPSPGEKVTLKVVREDGKPLNRNTALSLSVSDAQGKQTTSYNHNIYTYMLLGSELKGYLPDAMQYFDPGNMHRKEQLDLVMLTHGWTSYSWQNLARRKIEKFQPIERGITLKGTFLQKRIGRKFGHIGESLLTPQANNLIRLDIATDGKKGVMSTFRTDSVGEFVLELDDFFGKRIASLKPQTVFKHSHNISYLFALDRYFSPGFRLYDYWERHVGNIMSKSQTDSLIRLNPFEFMLSSVEVVGKRKKEINGRPPHSEMRLNYLDEWEYAQDITYLNIIDRNRDALYDAVFNDVSNNGEIEEVSIDADGRATRETMKTVVNGRQYDRVAYETDNTIFLHKDNSELNKYVGDIRYSGGDDDGYSTFPVDHDYDNTLTAADVVKSAIIRHGYHWAYWIQLMVVDSAYSSHEVPKVDMAYLRGVPDVEKMTNFKEIVIRSDGKTREMFENRDNYWKPLTFMMDNKIPVQKFYKGFLSHLYVAPSDDMKDSPNAYAFENSITSGFGVYYPINPNYVACMIPYTAEERENTYVPDYAATGSPLRYTSVQGYSESKQFYSPDYSKMTPRSDDYRRTLLWVPQVNVNDKGEAIIEFYNSSVCKELNVSVEGRSGIALFSNSDIMTTRESEKPEVVEEEKRVVQSEPLLLEESMDSVLMAQCAHEHEKGIIYYNQKRYKDAIIIFAELVQYKYAPALYYIGRCYRDGTGLAKNDKLSVSFLLEAAKRNEPRAQYELAMAIFDGDMVEHDEKMALQWLEYAVACEEPRAMYEMARRCLEGDGVEQNSVLGRTLLEKSAMREIPEAMYQYGLLLLEEGGNGIRFINNAADMYHVDAMFYMLDSAEKSGNYNEAFRFAKRLSMAGYHEGTKRLADYFWNGKGVRRDKRTAKDLYREAATAGNKEAAEILKTL